jgi:hypothetical protein
VARRLDFRNHGRDLDANRYVYAVVSRRARGLSIGVNLNPDKACNFDCPYCQVDRTTPGGPSRIDVTALVSELELLLERARGDLWALAPFDSVAPELRRVADIAFAGDGEPTTPPEFPAAARAVRERATPGDRGAARLLTNATLFPAKCAQASPSSTSWCKLDAGSRPTSNSWTARACLPPRPRQPAMVAREQQIVIQAMLLARRPGPTTPVAAWVDRMREIVTQEAGSTRCGVYRRPQAIRPALGRSLPNGSRRSRLRPRGGPQGVRLRLSDPRRLGDRREAPVPASLMPGAS